MRQDPLRPIGGFLPLENDFVMEFSESVLSNWVGTDAVYLASSSRSALFSLVRSSSIQRLWLPAYSCKTIAPDLEVSYFPIDTDSLTPNVDFLESNVRDGDLVLAIDYFGTPQNAIFLDFVRSNPDIVWIQDCAQAMDPGTAWGHFRLYSPRKLFGVSDGGVLVGSPEHELWSLLPNLRAVSAHLVGLMPRVLRALELQVGVKLNAYDSYQFSESIVSVDQNAMSDYAVAQLNHISANKAATARKRNYARLHDHLSDYGMLSINTESWVPFGYPILSSERDLLVKKLASRGIFAASHWRTIPAPVAEFPDEHILSSRQVTLPCDQRYDENDMEWMAGEVIDVLKNLNRH